MPQPIEPIEIPIATHVQIESFEINVEDLVGEIRYSEGIQDDEGYKPLRRLTYHIDNPEMTQIMSVAGNAESTLYDQIKGILYDLIPYSVLIEESEEIEAPEGSEEIEVSEESEEIEVSEESEEP